MACALRNGWKGSNETQQTGSNHAECLPDSNGKILVSESYPQRWAQTLYGHPVIQRAARSKAHGERTWLAQDV